MMTLTKATGQSPVCYVMSYLNAEPARRDVYLLSSAPASVGGGYHKIRGSVKKGAPTATSWGRGGAYGIVEMTKGKLIYQFPGSLLCKDIRNVEAQRQRPVGRFSSRPRPTSLATEPQSQRGPPLSELGS
jgi:hypothetical protein